MRQVIRRVTSLRDRCVVITGASRGIGRAIALRCADDGANLVLLARSLTQPSHPLLSGSLQDVCIEVEERGGVAMPVQVDVSRRDDVHIAMETVAHRFGTIDCIVSNASAIDVSEKLPDARSYDRMMDVNVRGTYHLLREAVPYMTHGDLRQALSISPPLKALDVRWMTPHPCYTVSKYGMTMLTLGMSDVLRANTLWPRKLVATAATRMLEQQTGIPGHSQGRPASEFAETAYDVLCSDATGMSLLDVDVREPSDVGGVDDIFI